jgi:hypothetical protein
MFCSPFRISNIVCLYDFGTAVDFNSLSNDDLLTIHHNNKFKNWLAFKCIYGTLRINNSGIVQLTSFKSILNVEVVLNHVATLINPGFRINPDSIKISLIIGSFRLFDNSDLTSSKKLNLVEWHEKLGGSMEGIGFLFINLYWCDDHNIPTNVCKCHSGIKKSSVFMYQNGTITISNKISFQQIDKIYNFINFILTYNN